jgi:hypothetical protein
MPTAVIVAYSPRSIASMMACECTIAQIGRIY